MAENMTRGLPADLNENRVLSARQAAELLGISVATFRRQYWAGKLPKPIRVSDRRLGWFAKSLLRHVASRVDAAA